MSHPNYSIRTVEWKNDHLVLLDQRHLPHAEKYMDLYSAEDTAEAIRNRIVRGAPAMGLAAAYGMVMAARKCYKQYPHDWRLRVEAEKKALAEARPTAVNIQWALDLLSQHLDQVEGDPIPSVLALAKQLHEDDISGNIRMATLGSTLLEANSTVLTHGNGGALACGGYGTALGVVRTAFSTGKLQQVYVNESRPLWQGSRLTTWELMKDSIPFQVLADGAAAHLMAQNKVNIVLVGAECVAANGDIAGKIGTYQLAISARFHNVKLVVVAPTSSFSRKFTTGAMIPLEERPIEELISMGTQRITVQHADAWNPAFDVTPAHLIDAIVTEKGIIEQPDASKISALLG